MATEISAELVKQLRERTGIGIGKCKEALRGADGDMETAIANLRKAGLASAVKKEGRETNEGVIAFADTDATVALVEVNAETDFVVTNDTFQEFSRNLVSEAASTKPKDVASFATQKYSQDPSMTIDEYRSLVIQKIGENLQIRRVKIFDKSKDLSIGVYSHMGGKIVVVVELEGSGEEVLARDIAMHIAAESPDYVSPDEVPERLVEHEKEIARAQVKGKPENILDKIVSGKIEKFFEGVCLLKQKFVKKPENTVQQVVDARAKEASKPLKVRSFVRWSIG